jgi:hypothetical protein
MTRGGCGTRDNGATRGRGTDKRDRETAQKSLSKQTPKSKKDPINPPQNAPASLVHFWGVLQVQVSQPEGMMHYLGARKVAK